MRANPAEHERRIRLGLRNRFENIRIYDRGNDTRARAFTGNVFSDRSIAASNNRGPSYQIVGLAKPLQSLADSSVSWTLVRNISRIIQVKNHWLLQAMGHDPFNERRPEQHRFALDQNHIGLSG